MWQRYPDAFRDVFEWRVWRLPESCAVERAALQRAGLPCGLRGECLVWLFVLQCVVRQWDPDAESQHFGAACEWRRCLSCVVCESGVQHAMLRCGLRDGRLVWLVCLQRFLWPRHADAESGRVGCCVLRRRVLWRVVSGSAVQCAAVPRELHVECMVWLVFMQCHLWWRHADTDSFR